MLKKWKPADSEVEWFVFSGSTSTTPLTEARQGMAPVLSQANVRSFRFHDLRHTFASNLVRAGVDLNTVRALLGHHKISMPLRYAHLAPEHKAARSRGARKDMKIMGRARWRRWERRGRD
jgi:site-specific recombinase XerD